jgi:hypothetical protein
MSKEEMILAESFEGIPIEDEIEIGNVLNDIEEIVHGKTGIDEDDFKPEAREMFDKLQKTSDWLYQLRQIERIHVSELQESTLERLRAVFKGKSVKSKISELDQKIIANQELTNFYNEFQIDRLLEKRPKK